MAYTSKDLPARPAAKRPTYNRRKNSDLAKKMQASFSAKAGRNLPEGMQTTKGRYCTMIFRGISKQVRANYKAFCVRHGTNMTADVEDYMRRRGNEDIGAEHIKRQSTKRGREMVNNGRLSRAYVPSVPLAKR